MRIPSLLIALPLLGAGAWAQDDHFYLQLGEGIVFSEEADGVPGGSIGFDPGFSAGVAFGYEYYLGENWSIAPELELFYQYFTVDEDDLPAIPSAVEDDAKTFAVMVNGTLDWHITKQFSWYVGGGVGWADVIKYDAWDSGNLAIDDSSGIAGQVRLGVGFNLGGSYDFRFGGRYFKTEPVDIEDQITGEVDEIDVGQFSLEATFRWGF